MMAKKTATAASHTISALTISRNTDHFAQNPRKGGTPPMENIRISMRNADHGLRSLSPLKSSSRSASKPFRDSRMIIPKLPIAMTA